MLDNLVLFNTIIFEPISDIPETKPKERPRSKRNIQGRTKELRKHQVTEKKQTLNQVQQQKYLAKNSRYLPQTSENQNNIWLSILGVLSLASLLGILIKRK